MDLSIAGVSAFMSIHESSLKVIPTNILAVANKNQGSNPKTEP
jgi:hypothetical protein